MWIALDGRMFRQRFENGAHIANRYFFIEEILQHFMQCGERDDAGNEIFRQLWHLRRRDPTAVAPPDDQTALRHAG